MKVVRPDGMNTPLYVLPDVGRTPLAGSFASGFAARLWIVQHVEAGLSPAKLAVWRAVSERLGAPTDLGLELSLIGLVARGYTVEQVGKYVPRAVVDRRRLASGEREAA